MEHNFNFSETLREIKKLNINTNDNTLLSMILLELNKLNNNIEKYMNLKTTTTTNTLISEESKPKKIQK